RLLHQKIIMNIKKIKIHNSQTFLDDIKRVREIMCFSQYTNAFFQLKKKDVLKHAQNAEIKYYITDDIFMVKRDVMVLM
ncbi:MAG: hypothetical protein ACRC26_10815, partial [Bacteroidales bacterium]